MRGSGIGEQLDMPENQEDIDALLAEVNALADEAVADIVGNEAAPEPTASASSVATMDPSPKRTSSTDAKPRSYRQEDLDRILHLEVPVIVHLAHNTMSLSDIVRLTTGAIIEFDKPSDGELDLMINNKCIGHGQAVKTGENFGLRITQIGSLRDRITALGK